MRAAAKIAGVRTVLNIVEEAKVQVFPQEMDKMKEVRECCSKRIWMKRWEATDDGFGDDIGYSEDPSAFYVAETIALWSVQGKAFSIIAGAA
jgi:hypothetical protein